MDEERARRPVVAAVLTLLAPGLGHLYASDLRKAIAFFAGFLLFALLD